MDGSLCSASCSDLAGGFVDRAASCNLSAPKSPQRRPSSAPPPAPRTVLRKTKSRPLLLEDILTLLVGFFLPPTAKSFRLRRPQRMQRGLAPGPLRTGARFFSSA
ncbi:hypothetical protein BRADI_1g29425v3 [Brachypodium distachyon]|uniref:Uncharacterized protein n=1 Tax=Brachypodium distachyon TaxID=15368 RepID=A0A2K2DLX9_BRADI|nr:hypothetical protein BRADI_1g29425v3 [Brachypodium distachyon]